MTSDGILLYRPRTKSIEATQSNRELGPLGRGAAEL